MLGNIFIYFCWNYVINGLIDSMWNVWVSKKTMNEFLESLDHKYKIEDVESKKFVVRLFLNNKMVDSKAIINQVKEIQGILHEIHSKEMH